MSDKHHLDPARRGAMDTLTEDRVRQIAREEALRVYNDSHPVPTPIPDVSSVTHTPPICGVLGRTGICTKPPKHGQRHRYSVPVRRTPPPDNGWRDIPQFLLQPNHESRRTYTIEKGSPVKVKGFGKGGGWQTGWYVTRIQCREGRGSLEDINVEINREGSHTRTVKATKIGYVRPSSKAGRASVKR